MPTYLYSCNTHGEFEAIHSINSKLEKCPQCVEERLFEYTCEYCEQKFTQANDIMSCPSCLSENISGYYAKPARLITGTSFILAGGGWANSGYSK